MIKTFDKFLNEAKEVGTLYHVLNFIKLIYVANNNELKPYGVSQGLSFTRRKMLNHYIGERAATFCKFEINGNKLSENYKIEPYQANKEYFSDKMEKK